MTNDRYALTDRILLEEHVRSPFLTFAWLTGYPDESDWHVISGTAHVEAGVLVLDDESPGLHRQRVDEADDFVSDLTELAPWTRTLAWRWASAPDGTPSTRLDPTSLAAE